MSHPLRGQKKTRQHKDRIRASMLARYARIREAVAAYEQLKATGVVITKEKR